MSAERIAGCSAIERITPPAGPTRLRKSVDAAIGDYIRQLILIQAKGVKVAELPYIIEDIPYGTPAERWYDALTNDNPPGKVTFRFKGDPEGYEAFRAEVGRLDMMSFDAELAASLRERFKRGAERNQVAFDALDAELEA